MCEIAQRLVVSCKTAEAMSSDLWNYRLAFQKKHSKSLELEITSTERKIEQLLDRIMDVESDETNFCRQIGVCTWRGISTPETTLPFEALSGFSGGENKMARPERFELPTLRFVV